MTYELTIDGTKYYFVNEADYNKVKDAETVEEQKELVSQYKSSEVSTDEDDLVEVDDRAMKPKERKMTRIQGT